MNLRLSFILPVLGFIALAAIFAVYLWQIGGGKDVRALPSVLIDKPAPALALPPVPGLPASGGLTSEHLKGEISLVNVFASWCGPCRAEHPILMRLAAEGVVIHAINYKDLPENAVRFLEELGNPYKRIGADRTGRAGIDWGVYGVPETFVIDQAGRIRYRHVGPLHGQALEDIVLPLIARLKG